MFCLAVILRSWINFFLFLSQHGYRDFLQSPLQVNVFKFIEMIYIAFVSLVLSLFLCGNTVIWANVTLIQPLMDNLEAQTYETFEKDTVKYTQVLSALKKNVCEVYIFYHTKVNATAFMIMMLAFFSSACVLIFYFASSQH